MTRYRVEFTITAATEIRALDPQVRQRLLTGISELEQEPRPSGACKLPGYAHASRVRVSDAVVLYDVNDDQALVTVVGLA